MSLLEMCPQTLKDKLYTQPEVGSGRISFEDLEKLITTHVHNNWDKGRGINALDANLGTSHPNGPDTSVEFEIAGEIYKLEYKDGKRVPIKINKPANT